MNPTSSPAPLAPIRDNATRRAQGWAAYDRSTVFRASVSGKIVVDHSKTMGGNLKAAGAHLADAIEGPVLKHIWQDSGGESKTGRAINKGARILLSPLAFAGDVVYGAYRGLRAGKDVLDAAVHGCIAGANLVSAPCRGGV